MSRDLVSRTEPESHPKLTNLFQTTSLGSKCSITGFPCTYIMVLLNYMYYDIFISPLEALGVDSQVMTGEWARITINLESEPTTLGSRLGSLASQIKTSPFPRMFKVKDEGAWDD